MYKIQNKYDGRIICRHKDFDRLYARTFIDEDTPVYLIDNIDEAKRILDMVKHTWDGVNVSGWQIIEESQMKKYKIVDVLHSGRKGPRNESYEWLSNIVGTKIYADLSKIEQFDCFIWDFVDYDYTWFTGPVIQLTARKNDVLELETIDAIYILQLIND